MNCLWWKEHPYNSILVTAGRQCSDMRHQGIYSRGINISAHMASACLEDSLSYVARAAEL